MDMEEESASEFTQSMTTTTDIYEESSASTEPAEITEITESMTTTDIYNCQDQLVTALTRTEFSKVDGQDYIAINMTLFHKSILREKVYSSLHDYSTHDELEYEAVYTIILNLTHTDHLPNKQDFINNVIYTRLRIPEEHANQLSIDLLRFARDILVRQNPDDAHNVFNFEVQVTSVHCHDLVPRSLWGEIGDGPLMIPATDESIKKLERKRIGANDSDQRQSCVICMEDFPEGCEAVLMPCLHSFHGDCIEQWLNTSHYCPICRFEMPIN